MRIIVTVFSRIFLLCAADQGFARNRQQGPWVVYTHDEVVT